jgi:hypothetical protein
MKALGIFDRMAGSDRNHAASRRRDLPGLAVGLAFLPRFSFSLGVCGISKEEEK